MTLTVPSITAASNLRENPSFLVTFAKLGFRLISEYTDVANNWLTNSDEETCIADVIL
jgi:hypothetical protein